MQKKHSSFSHVTGYLQLLHLGALPVTRLLSTGGLKSELFRAIYMHSDRLVFYFGLLNLILLLIGNLVFCYGSFLEEIIFAINYIQHRVHTQHIKGPRKLNPMTWVQLEC